MKKTLLALMAMATIGVSAQTQTQVKNLYASTSSLNVEKLMSSEQTVQLNRYLFAGYNTLCLPMSMTVDQLSAANGVMIERFAGIRQEGNVLNLYFIDCTEDGVEAGVPYLIYSPKTQYLRVKNTEAQNLSKDIKIVRMTDADGNRVSFGSSWESMRKDGLYGIPAQQNTAILESVLIRTVADKEFLPTRCGFSWELQSGNATELKIVHIKSLAEMETTGIQTLKNSSRLVDIYDLKGNVVMRQIRANDAKNVLQRGVYVIDGEKVSVK